MKKYFLFLLAGFLLIAACSKDQAMVNKVEGEWDIEQIIFTKNGKDSVVTAPVGVFAFEKCKQVKGACPGFYETENFDRVEISYIMDELSGQMHINNLSSGAEIMFSGKYEIESFTRKRLSIKGQSDVSRGDEYTSYEIKTDLKKK